MEQFRLEVARDGQGYFYDIHSLGDNRYDIFKEEVKVGTLQLDDKDHQHCEAIDCDLYRLTSQFIILYDNPCFRVR